MVRAKTAYLGVGGIRDSVSLPTNNQYADYVAMANSGLKLTTAVSGTPNISGIQAQVNVFSIKYNDLDTMFNYLYTRTSLLSRLTLVCWRQWRDSTSLTTLDSFTMELTSAKPMLECTRYN